MMRQAPASMSCWMAALNPVARVNTVPGSPRSTRLRLREGSQSKASGGGCGAVCGAERLEWREPGLGHALFSVVADAIASVEEVPGRLAAAVGMGSDRTRQGMKRFHYRVVYFVRCREPAIVIGEISFDACLAVHTEESRRWPAYVLKPRRSPKPHHSTGLSPIVAYARERQSRGTGSAASTTCSAPDPDSNSELGL